VGVLQYIAPTLQFPLGVLVYGEQFTQAQLIGFGLVWTALVIFGIEGLAAHGWRIGARIRTGNDVAGHSGRRRGPAFVFSHVEVGQQGVERDRSVS
jgi:hypothetical protein